MFANKKSVFIVLSCFLITLFSLPHLWAQEELKKTPLDQQKSKNTQKKVPTFSIKGTTVKTVPKKGVSEQQKSEGTQEQVSTENQPQLSLATDHYDGGEVWEGDAILHSFTVRNTGTGKLNIKNVKPG